MVDKPLSSHRRTYSYVSLNSVGHHRSDWRILRAVDSWLKWPFPLPQWACSMTVMTSWSATHLRSTTSLPLRYKFPQSIVKGPHFFNKTCACARHSCFRKNAPSIKTRTMYDTHDGTWLSIMNNVAFGVSLSTPWLLLHLVFVRNDLRVHGLFLFSPPPWSRTRV